MKKLFSSILCAALICCMLFVLTACGTAGHYVFKEMSYSGMKISAEEAELDPEENYIDLNADGTAVMCINGDSAEMLWEDGQIWAKDQEDDKADFEIDDGELTIEVNNMEMVFEKE